MPAPDSSAVRSMFGRIARRYDLANRVLSLGLDRKWRWRLVQAVARAGPGCILDLACGSGDVALALSRGLQPGTRIVGVDFSPPMLAQAERKKASAMPGTYSEVTFAVGDAQNLEFPEGAFDAVTLAFGLRNMANRHRCLTEIFRVLGPAGRLHILEFSQPGTCLRRPYYFYLRRVLPAIAGRLTGDRAAYEYLNRTIEEFPTPEALSAEVAAAGFASVRFERLSGGIVALHEAAKGQTG